MVSAWPHAVGFRSHFYHTDGDALAQRAQVPRRVQTATPGPRGDPRREGRADNRGRRRASATNMGAPSVVLELTRECWCSSAARRCMGATNCLLRKGLEGELRDVVLRTAANDVVMLHDMMARALRRESGREGGPSKRAGPRRTAVSWCFCCSGQQLPRPTRSPIEEYGYNGFVRLSPRWFDSSSRPWSGLAVSRRRSGHMADAACECKASGLRVAIGHLPNRYPNGGGSGLHDGLVVLCQRQSRLLL